MTPQTTLDLIAGFQRTLIEELLEHCEDAAETMGALSLVISGGVACNAGLRDAARTSGLPYAVFFPAPALSTDNAAMIAAAAYRKVIHGQFADMSLKGEGGTATWYMIDPDQPCVYYFSRVSSASMFSRRPPPAPSV